MRAPDTGSGTRLRQAVLALATKELGSPKQASRGREHSKSWGADGVGLAACRTRACGRARRAITPDSPDGRLITCLAAWDRLDRSAAGSPLFGGGAARPPPAGG